MATKRMQGTSLLTVRYGSVLFPFDVVRLLMLVPSLGYEVVDELQGLQPGVGTLKVEGAVAKKLEVTLQIDTRAGTVGVLSPEARTSVEEFERVLSFLKTELGVDTDQLGHFFELIANYTSPSAKSPLESWKQQAQELPIARAMSEVIGKPASLYGLRLTPEGAIPNQESWFDIRIEPKVLAPHKEHQFNVIFRSRDRAEVVGFTMRLPEMLGQLAGIVEGQSDARGKL